MTIIVYVDRGPVHDRLRVFFGPDEQHMALAGTLYARTGETDDLLAAFAAGVEVRPGFPARAPAAGLLKYCDYCRRYHVGLSCPEEV